MKLVPYETQSYHTSLTPAQVRHQLEQLTGSLPGLLSNEALPTMLTEFKGYSFRLNPVGRWGMHLLSEMRGEMSSIGHGTLVRIKWRAHTFMLVLMVGWLAFIQAALLWFLLEPHATFMAGLFVISLNVLFLLVYGWFLYAFRQQTSRSGRVVSQLLNRNR